MDWGMDEENPFLKVLTNIPSNHNSKNFVGEIQGSEMFYLKILR